MAYLSRRPDTFYLRLLLLPLVVCLALATYFGFMYEGPEYNIYNWGQGLFAEVVCAKAIDFAWRREGMLKTGETKPGVLSKSYADRPQTARAGRLPAWLYDSLEVALTSRGLGWQFSAGLHVPADQRPPTRSDFIWATALSTVKHFVVFDLMESLIKLVPGVGSPGGGTMYQAGLPGLQRQMLAMAVHVATGTCLIAGFEMVHGCAALIALTVLSSSPAMWPPLMDDPWISDSLHDFWARRWHQALRQTFFVYGGFAGKWVGGDMGMLFGTFIASGMFHECSAYMLGSGFDWKVVGFFGLQAVLVLVEKAWRRGTGRRVGGMWGRAWVYLCMFVVAQPVVDSWHARGLGGGQMVPPGISPTRRVLLPLLRRAEGAIGFGPLTAMEALQSAARESR